MEDTHTVREKAIMATVAQLPKYFDGMSERQVRNYVDEMESEREFREGVIRVTSRTTLVDIEKFISYLQFKAQSRYRTTTDS